MAAGDDLRRGGDQVGGDLDFVRRVAARGTAPRPEPGAPDSPPVSTDPADVWRALVEAVGRLGQIAFADDVPDDAQVRAEGLRYLLRFLAAGIAVCVEHDDPDDPELGRMITERMSWGLDNPDTLYLYTRLDGTGTYRLQGDAGTACHLELQVNTGHYADGDFAGWRAVSALAGDELVRTDGDHLDVLLAPDGAAAPGTGPEPPNRMMIDASAGFLVVRQYFDDWIAERPARLTIERLDAPLPPVHLRPERVTASVDRLVQWLDVGARCWDQLSRGLMSGTPGDIHPFVPPSDSSGMKGLAYGFGSFACEPDQAVILRLDPPSCRMWGISLCDRYWQTVDFASRQSSLNSSQARPAADGTVTAVIAHHDPGVANWIDPAGHHHGTLAVRYLFPDHLPPLQYRTVPLAELDAALPGDLARVTADERRRSLSARRAAVSLRYGS